MQTLAANLPDKLAALSQSTYFSACRPEILNQLAEVTSLRRCQRGEILFWEGDPCNGLYIIRQGSVKLFKISPNGRELIIRALEDGATFNEVPVFDNGRNPVNAAALEECEIWVVEAEPIRAALRQYPEMCQAVIQNLSKNLRMLVQKVEELSFYQVTNRLARLIHQLPQEQLVGPQTQRITQDQLAARLGTVREVVARSLRELERSGAIRLNNRQILVLDQKLLQDWAQGPCE
jgi:CRP/FNR family transcriptional regulator